MQAEQRKRRRKWKLICNFTHTCSCIFIHWVKGHTLNSTGAGSLFGLQAAFCPLIFLSWSWIDKVWLWKLCRISGQFLGRFNEEMPLWQGKESSLRIENKNDSVANLASDHSSKWLRHPNVWNKPRLNRPFRGMLMCLTKGIQKKFITLVEEMPSKSPKTEKFHWRLGGKMSAVKKTYRNKTSQSFSSGWNRSLASRTENEAFSSPQATIQKLVLKYALHVLTGETQIAPGSKQ